MSIAFTDYVLEEQEKQIQVIMEEIENARGPLHDQEALYEEAWEEWEKRNETRVSGHLIKGTYLVLLVLMLKELVRLSTN